MNQKNEDDDKKADEDEPGFLIRLPMGSWIRGGRDQLSAMMPALTWAVLLLSLGWVLVQIIRELRLNE